MAVNLSSERVRTALAFLEGIRHGQQLGALLGYQFERGLHDRYDDLANCPPKFLDASLEAFNETVWCGPLTRVPS